MSLSLMDKLTKALAFLVASRDGDIAKLLATRGYTPAIRKEGWRLLATAGGADLENGPLPIVRGDPELTAALEKLEQWEGEWLPVLTASLQRHHPAVAAKVLANLSATQGREVVVLVDQLLKRLDALTEVPQGAAALRLLESRGFTAEVRKAAADQLALVRTQSAVQVPDPGLAAAAEQEKALEELWAWYGEWSHIARVVVSRGDHLIRLGMRKRGRPSTKGGEVEVSSP